MPVIINKNKQERGSTNNSNGITSVPELNHENKLTICDFSVEPFSSTKINIERINFTPLLSKQQLDLSEFQSNIYKYCENALFTYTQL